MVGFAKIEVVTGQEKSVRSAMRDRCLQWGLIDIPKSDMAWQPTQRDDRLLTEVFVNFKMVLESLQSPDSKKFALEPSIGT